MKTLTVPNRNQFIKMCTLNSFFEPVKITSSASTCYGAGTYYERRPSINQDHRSPACLVVVVSVPGRLILPAHIHHNGAGRQQRRVPTPHNRGVLVARQQLQHRARQHLGTRIFCWHLFLYLFFAIRTQTNRQIRS